MIAKYIIPVIFWISISIPFALLLFVGSKKTVRKIRALIRLILSVRLTTTARTIAYTTEIVRLNDRITTLQNQINLMLADPKLYSKDKKSGQISLPLGKLENHQRMLIRLPSQDGIEVYSLDYSEWLNWNNGKTKVERTSYTRDGRNWAKVKKILWVTENTLSTKDYTYTDNDHCYRDRIIDLDYRFEYIETDNTPANNNPPAPVGQLSLFGN